MTLWNRILTACLRVLSSVSPLLPAPWLGSYTFHVRPISSGVCSPLVPSVADTPAGLLLPFSPCPLAPAVWGTACGSARPTHNERTLWNRILVGLEKEGNPGVGDTMDEPGGCYAKWNKPDTNTAWSRVWNLRKLNSIATAWKSGHLGLGKGSGSCVCHRYRLAVLSKFWGPPVVQHADRCLIMCRILGICWERS